MNECCKLAPYEHEVAVNVQAQTPACIVVFRESGADGSLTPLAQVPVTLAPSMRLPGTGAATPLPLILVVGMAVVLLSVGVLVRRRIRLDH
jgi:LPXTG-motif cell wall-anchored protein